ncbi:MAG TPA: GGDEF domain-containing protein [Candidatus Saccharimonadales bacterium]|nr:GGDEF domain-containing protein [Candidatus Saccharimonadales bacterium]
MTEQSKGGLSRQFNLEQSLANANKDLEGHVLPIAAQVARDYYEKDQQKVSEIEELRSENERLEDQALIDSKTGLPNAQGLKLAYEKLVNKQPGHRRTDVEENENNSMLFVDLDQFGLIDKTIGHPSADKLLMVVGQFLKGSLRDQDTVGRFGGDEFVAICPGTTKEEAAVIAERMRTAIEGISEVEGREVHPTTSIGVGEVNPGLSFLDSLEEANRAMLDAKEAGRNQVIVFSEAA